MSQQQSTTKKYQWDPYNDEDSIVPVSENNTPIQTPKGNRLKTTSFEGTLNASGGSAAHTPQSESFSSGQLIAPSIPPQKPPGLRRKEPTPPQQPQSVPILNSPPLRLLPTQSGPTSPGYTNQQPHRGMSSPHRQTPTSPLTPFANTCQETGLPPPTHVVKVGTRQDTQRGTVKLEEVSRCITKLRAATRDSQVDTAIPQLRPELQHAMLDAILQADPEPSTGRTAVPKLFLDLCQNVRGNVIFHLLRYNLLRAKSGQPPAAYIAPIDVHLRLLVQHIETAWQELAYGKSSSVALSRFMTILPTWALQHIGRTMVQCYPDLLAQHAYGNFLVQDILKVAVQTPEEFEDVFAGLATKFSPPQTFADLACSKFGSHVIEGFLKAAPPQHNTQLCTPLFQSPAGELILMLGSHEQGNYPLQVVFRVLRQQQSPLFAQVLEQVIPHLEFCVYRAQLLIAAGLEVTPAPRRRH